MADKDLHGVDPSEYKHVPGNQTAGTPDVVESEGGRYGGDDPADVARSTGQHDLRGIDPSEYKHIPGNQTAGTPDVDESHR